MPLRHAAKRAAMLEALTASGAFDNAAVCTLIAQEMCEIDVPAASHLVDQLTRRLQTVQGLPVVAIRGAKGEGARRLKRSIGLVVNANRAMAGMGAVLASPPVLTQQHSTQTHASRWTRPSARSDDTAPSATLTAPLAPRPASAARRLATAPAARLGPPPTSRDLPPPWPPLAPLRPIPEAVVGAVAECWIAQLCATGCDRRELLKFTRLVCGLDGADFSRTLRALLRYHAGRGATADAAALEATYLTIEAILEHSRRRAPASGTAPLETRLLRVWYEPGAAAGPTLAATALHYKKILLGAQPAYLARRQAATRTAADGALERVIFALVSLFVCQVHPPPPL